MIVATVTPGSVIAVLFFAAWIILAAYGLAFDAHQWWVHRQADRRAPLLIALAADEDTAPAERRRS